MMLFVAMVVELSTPSLEFLLYLVQIFILVLMALDLKIPFSSPSL